MRRVWICLATFMLLACGHSDEEIAAKQREIERVQAALLVATNELHDEKAQAESRQREMDEIKRRVELDILEERANERRDDELKAPARDCK